MRLIISTLEISWNIKLSLVSVVIHHFLLTVRAWSHRAILITTLWNGKITQ